MPYDQREEHRTVAAMTATSYFRDQLRYLTGIVRRSRVPLIRTKWWWINGLQSSLLLHLFEVQEAVRKGKALEHEATDPNERQRTRLQWQMNDRVARAIQVVGDGIAWRALRYKRAYIRLLSENRDSGPLTTHERDTFRRVLRSARDTIVVNDLTRCLRIADLTVVTSDGEVTLVESKKGGKSFKDVADILAGLRSGSHAPTRQNQRHLIAQFAFRDRRILVPATQNGGRTEARFDIVDLDFPVHHHLKTVGRLLSAAKRNGFAVAILEPGYLICVTAFERFAAREAEFAPMLEKYGSERDEQMKRCFGTNLESVVQFTSLDALMKEDGHFPRNSVPLSVLPFADSDCAELMLGFIKVEVLFDLNQVKTRLEERGWRVENLMKGDFRAPQTGPDRGDLIAYGPKSWENFLRIERDVGGATYFSILPISWVIIMLSGFYTTAVLCDLEHALFEVSQRDKSNRALVANLMGEAQLLR